MSHKDYVPGISQPTNPFLSRKRSYDRDSNSPERKKISYFNTSASERENLKTNITTPSSTTVTQTSASIMTSSTSNMTSSSSSVTKTPTSSHILTSSNMTSSACDNSKDFITCQMCDLTFNDKYEFEKHLFSVIHHRILDTKIENCAHFCILCWHKKGSMDRFVYHLKGNRHQKNLAARQARVENGTQMVDVEKLIRQESIRHNPTKPAKQLEINKQNEQKPSTSGAVSMATTLTPSNDLPLTSKELATPKKSLLGEKPDTVSRNTGNHGYQRSNSAGGYRDDYSDQSQRRNYWDDYHISDTYNEGYNSGSYNPYSSYGRPNSAQSYYTDDRTFSKRPRFSQPRYSANYNRNNAFYNGDDNYVRTMPRNRNLVSDGSSYNGGRNDYERNYNADKAGTTKKNNAFNYNANNASTMSKYRLNNVSTMQKDNAFNYNAGNASTTRNKNSPANKNFTHCDAISGKDVLSPNNANNANTMQRNNVPMRKSLLTDTAAKKFGFGQESSKETEKIFRSVIDEISQPSVTSMSGKSGGLDSISTISRVSNNSVLQEEIALKVQLKLTELFRKKQIAQKQKDTETPSSEKSKENEAKESEANNNSSSSSSGPNSKKERFSAKTIKPNLSNCRNRVVSKSSTNEEKSPETLRKARVAKLLKEVENNKKTYSVPSKQRKITGPRFGITLVGNNEDSLINNDVVTSQLPSVTSQLPSVTSQLPSVTSQLPSVTSQLPSVTSQGPSVTSQLPSVTSQLPVTSQGPSMTSQEIMFEELDDSEVNDIVASIKNMENLLELGRDEKPVKIKSENICKVEGFEPSPSKPVSVDPPNPLKLSIVDPPNPLKPPLSTTEDHSSTSYDDAPRKTSCSKKSKKNGGNKNRKRGGVGNRGNQLGGVGNRGNQLGGVGNRGNRLGGATGRKSFSERRSDNNEKVSKKNSSGPILRDQVSVSNNGDISSVAREIDGRVSGEFDGRVSGEIGGRVSGEIGGRVSGEFGGRVSGEIGGSVAAKIRSKRRESLTEKMENLEEEKKSLRSEIKQVDHLIDQLIKRRTKLVGDIDKCDSKLSETVKEILDLSRANKNPVPNSTKTTPHLVESLRHSTPCPSVSAEIESDIGSVSNFNETHYESALASAVFGGIKQEKVPECFPTASMNEESFGNTGDKNNFGNTGNENNFGNTGDKNNFGTTGDENNFGNTVVKRESHGNTDSFPVKIESFSVGEIMRKYLEDSVSENEVSSTSVLGEALKSMHPELSLSLEKEHANKKKTKKPNNEVTSTTAHSNTVNLTNNSLKEATKPTSSKKKTYFKKSKNKKNKKSSPNESTTPSSGEKVASWLNTLSKPARTEVALTTEERKVVRKRDSFQKIHKCSVIMVHVTAGNNLVTCSKDKTICITNLGNDSTLGVHTLKSRPTSCILNGNVIYVVCSNSKPGSFSQQSELVKVSFNEKSGSVEFKEEQLLTAGSHISSLHYSNNKVFVGDSDGHVTVFDTIKGRTLATLDCHSPQIVTCLWVGREGAREVLCCGSNAGAMSVRSSEDGLLLKSLSGHNSAVNCLKLHNNLLYSGSSDRIVLVHNINTGAIVQRLTQNHGGGIKCLELFGDYLATLCLDKQVRVFQNQKLKILKVVKTLPQSMAIHDFSIRGGLMTPTCSKTHATVVPVACVGCHDGSVHVITLPQLANKMDAYDLTSEIENNGHESEEAANYMCKWGVCTASGFKSPSELMNHVNLFHGYDLTVLDQCCSWDNCYYYFSYDIDTPLDIRLHLEKHVNEDPPN